MIPDPQGGLSATPRAGRSDSGKRRGSRAGVALATLLWMALGASSASAKTLYVKPTGDDNNNGSSWSKAKLTVNGALKAAIAGDEVWVATQANYAYFESTVKLKDGVSVYGGFKGSETQRSQRDWRANPTVLSAGAPVVSARYLKLPTRFDGFTVRKGGAGLSVFRSTLTISNCLVCNNQQGGLELIESPQAVVVNNTIWGNYRSMGGGVYCESSGAAIRNNLIAWNTGSRGAGLYLVGNSSPVVSNNTFVANGTYGARGDGGAIGLDGVTNRPLPTLANNLIAFNNSGIWLNNYPLPVLFHNCVYGNQRYDYLGVEPGATDLSVNPRLLSTLMGDYHLAANSPCINVGDNAYVSAGDLDMDGNARLGGAKVDIGADEFVTARTLAPTRRVIYVRADGSDDRSGLTWALGKQTVQGGIDASSAGDQIWVAGGVYAERITLKAGVQIYGGFSVGGGWQNRNPSYIKSILNGDGFNTVVTIRSLGGNVTFDGFTVQNGYQGLFISDSMTVIRGNTITGNVNEGVFLSGSSDILVNNTISDNGEAGILANAYKALITANRIQNNEGGFGAGIYLYGNNSQVTRNTLIANSALYDGGGLYVDGGTKDCLIANNLIVGNTAQGKGGGIELARFQGTVANNTIVKNSAAAGAAGGIGNQDQNANATAHLVNNILANNSGFGVQQEENTGATQSFANCLFGNKGGTYDGTAAGAGDLLIDPLFVNLNAGNLRLRADSPCIDKGAANLALDGLDHDGLPRKSGAGVDLGAYEFQSPLVLQHATTGQAAFWTLGKPANDKLPVPFGALLPDNPTPAWQVVGTADFDGDGQLDLLLQNSVSGQILVWYLDATTLRDAAVFASNPTAAYPIVAVTDLNGDGKPDLVLQNKATHQIALWYLDGTSVVKGEFVSLVPNAVWQVVGMADMNGDGKPDLILQHTQTGQVAVWYLNGAKYLSYALVNQNPGAASKVVGVSDLNGDGKPDLILQNITTGQVSVWYLSGTNGTTYLGKASAASNLGALWLVMGVR